MTACVPDVPQILDGDDNNNNNDNDNKINNNNNNNNNNRINELLSKIERLEREIEILKSKPTSKDKNSLNQLKIKHC